VRTTGHGDIRAVFDGGLFVFDTSAREKHQGMLNKFYTHSFPKSSKRFFTNITNVTNNKDASSA
jgi:hypothetical protein